MVEVVQIKKEDDLGAWLANKPREWAGVVATRAALRVLPLVGYLLVNAPVGIEANELYLASMRAAFLSWVARRYPFSNLAFEARHAAGIAHVYAGSIIQDDKLREKVRGAGYAIEAAAYAADAVAGSHDIRMSSANAAKYSHHAAFRAGDAGDDLWASIAADASWLANYMPTRAADQQASQLASEKLWLNDVRGNAKYNVNFPIWAREPWDALKKTPRVLAAGFVSWIHWYDGRLLGGNARTFNPSLSAIDAKNLEIHIAKQSAEFWSRSAESVNAEIKRWIEGALQPPLYNLLVSASSDTWKNPSAKILRSRFLEHTDEALAKRFRSLDSETARRLTLLPSVFAYEAPLEAYARVGFLRDIHVTGRTIEIWFEFDPSIRPISPEKFSQIQERLGVSNAERYRTHWAIKKVDLYSVLSDVGLSSNASPAEPPEGPGPLYGLRNGKLSENVSIPIEGEPERQSGLHHILKRDAIKLAENLRRVANRFPELANVADEYSVLINKETADVDVTAIWCVGGSLASFARSYREQNAAKTLTEPLEPQLDALLQSVVRQHGAFVMGFEQGLDLVRRADEFAVDTVRLSQIEPPGNALLRELTENRQLVDDRTRALHRPVRDSVAEFGWTASRVGYSAYLVVRNAVRAMIKFSVGESANAGTIVAVLTGASVLVGDPSAEFIRAAVPVLQQYSVQLLVFFNHSPEMRAYVEWALQILETDKENRR